MARRSKAASSSKYNEKDLSKGHLRKLNALRKSLGPEIAEKAFAEWYSKQGTEEATAVDKNAAMIAEALVALIAKKQLRIPRGGYHITRGRGRVIVTRMQQG